jgi:hypothetical protein
MVALRGWIRLGVVACALWVVSMFAYAAYEFLTFPLGPFTTTTTFPDGARPWQTETFFFVGLASAPWREREPQAAAYLEREIAKEESEKAKAVMRASLYSTEYRSTLLPLFWVVLIAGLVVFWVVASAGVVAYRWVHAGFAKRDEN